MLFRLNLSDNFKIEYDLLTYLALAAEGNVESFNQN